MDKAERAVVLTKLHSATDEAGAIQDDLDRVDVEIQMADGRSAWGILAGLYAREAELLHEKAKAVERVAAITYALAELSPSG